MKRILIFLLTVSILFSTASGIILFNIDAAAVARMVMPGFDAFTEDELSQVAVTVGSVNFTRENERTVLNLTEMVNDGWGNYVVSLSPAKTSKQDVRNELIGGKSFFGDVDLSNKQGIKFRIVNTGAEGTVPFSGKVSFCFGSSTRNIAIDYKNVGPDGAGYYTVDWDELGTAIGREFIWTDWYTDCTTIAETYCMGIDQAKITFTGEKDKKYSFYIDDLHAFAGSDTVALCRAIREAKALGTVSDFLISDAEEVYKNTESRQGEIDGITQKLLSAIDEAKNSYEKSKNDLGKLLDTAELLGYSHPDSENYKIFTEAKLVCDNIEAAPELIRYYIDIVRLLVASDTMEAELYSALEKAVNIWEYNYTADSYKSLKYAIERAWEIYQEDEEGALTVLTEAYSGLVCANIRINTGNFFEDWSTAAVNKVVEANPERVCDSVGNGLNEKDVWNNGDFSRNTVFKANSNLSLTASTDFINAAIGWRNTDTSGLVAGSAGGAYPALSVKGLSKSDGIRFKLEVVGKAERLLIGLSDRVLALKEQYAYMLRPEYADAQGYINIPFSSFDSAWWSEAFLRSELENAVGFSVEVYGVTGGTTVTISDICGYIALENPSEEQLAKLGNIIENLADFDIDGRYTDVIIQAEAVRNNGYAVDCEAICDEIYTILKEYKDPEAAVIDVPGFSIYTQQELDQITGLGGENVFTKTERGFKYASGPGDYGFCNGIYIPGTGLTTTWPYDPFYGAHNSIGGKSFIDMLGGFKLSEIYAFRFKVENANPGKFMGINFKDEHGIWGGMYTNRHDAYEGEDGYFTYYVDQIPTGAFDGWYGEKANTKENILNNTVYCVFQFFNNDKRDIYGWQVLTYEGVDRSALREALVSFSELGLTGYDEAMAVYYDVTATSEEIETAAEDLVLQVHPKRPATPVAESVTHESVVLKTSENNIEFRLGEDGQWQASPEFTGLNADTVYTFYARRAATNILPASEPSIPLRVCTAKTPIEGTLTINGNAVYGETLIATLEDTNATDFVIEWYRNGRYVAEGEQYLLSRRDIGTTVSATVSSDLLSGKILSANPQRVSKATPIISASPADVKLSMGKALSEAELIGGQTDVNGSWSWATPDIIPEASQSGSSFTAVFNPTNRTCYNSVSCKVTVTLEADSEYREIYDDNSSLCVSGEFISGKEVNVSFTSITVFNRLYIDFLRAAKMNGGDNNFILFKDISFEGEGAYLGSLDISSDIGVEHAGKEYLVWYAVNGEIRSTLTKVNDNGIIVLPQYNLDLSYDRLEVLKVDTENNKLAIIVPPEAPRYIRKLQDELAVFGFDSHLIGWEAVEGMSDLFGSEGYGTVIYTDASKTTENIATKIDQYVRAGGNLICLGGPAFSYIYEKDAEGYKYVGTMPGTENVTSETEYKATVMFDCLAPAYETFPITNAVKAVTGPEQVMITESGYSLPDDMFSPSPRNYATGILNNRTRRFIPLIEALDEKGEVAGYLAYMMVLSSFTERDSVADCKGSAYASFCTNDTEFLAGKKVINDIATVAAHMQRGSYLYGGGTDEFAYFEGDRWQVGAEFISREGVSSNDSSGRYTVNVEIKSGESTVYKKQYYLYDFNDEYSVNYGKKNLFSEAWSTELSGSFTATAELCRDGVVIDRISHEVIVYKPKPVEERRYLQSVGNDLYLDGEIWKCYGVNYLPSSGISQTGAEYEKWLSDASFAPEVIEKDLRRIRDIGFNAVSVILYYDTNYNNNNLVYLVSLCERYGLKLYLSIREHMDPMYYNEDSHMKFKEIVVNQRIADMDTVIGYDISWETMPTSSPSWCNQNGMRAFQTEWNEWLVENYGSVSAAEEVWGYKLEKDAKGDAKVIYNLREVDDASRNAIVAYRRWVGDMGAEMYGRVVDDLRELDTNHIVGCRMGMYTGWATSEAVNSGWEYSSLASALDVMGPEGYGYYSKWEDDFEGALFSVLYSRYSCEKPLIWFEFGKNGWSGSNYGAADSEEIRKQGKYIELINRVLSESQSNGIFYWWYSGGYRNGEVSDCGIINPDGSDRPATVAIRNFASKFLNGKAVELSDNPDIVKGDCIGYGAKGLFDALKDKMRKAMENGDVYGMVDSAEGSTSLDTPLERLSELAIGPMRNLNADFRRVYYRTESDSEWKRLEEGGEITVKRNEKIYLKANVVNTGIAKWIASANASGSSGAVCVKLEGNSFDIESDVAKHNMICVEGIELSVSAEKDICMQMSSKGRCDFGEAFRFTVIAAE